MRQIIFGTLIVVLYDRGTNLRGRNAKHRADHPIRAAPEATQSHKVDILIGNAAKQAMHILYFQWLLHRRLLLVTIAALIVRHNARDALTRKLIGLGRTATILTFLAAAFDLRRFLQNTLPARLALSKKKISVLGKILINSKFGAANADALENIHNHGVKLNIVDRTGQSIVSKVAGAAMIRLAASAADFSIV